MKKIGLISDTHGLLRPEVIQYLQGCDAILHGGDINRQEILDQLNAIAPVYAVRGNNDGEWAEHLPLLMDFSLYGLRICMTHKKKDLPGQLEPYDLVLYGHSHRYEQKVEKKTYLVNPGSCGPRRWNQAVTLALLWLEEPGEIDRIEKIEIPHAAGKTITLEKVQKRDIEKAVGGIRKGFTVRQIAESTGMSEELAGQICRMYLTHPGVDADGIMTKLGL